MYSRDCIFQTQNKSQTLTKEENKFKYIQKRQLEENVKLRDDG
jgi:hypothetical protein